QETSTASMKWSEALLEAAAHGDESVLHRLIAVRWRNNEVTAGPLDATPEDKTSKAPTTLAPMGLDFALRGSRLTQMLHVVAKFGVADVVADEPHTAEEIARRVDANTDALRRLLRALVDVGIFMEDTDGRFGLGREGRRLRSDAPDSVRAAAIVYG